MQHDLAVAASPHPFQQTGHRHPENPLVLVHRYLRGRYPLAVALGLLLGIPFALAGYLAVPPTYQSKGMVRVAPYMPKTMYTTEENKLMPMFDAFVASQAQYLQSRRVMDMAVNSDELLAAGWPAGFDGLALLEKKLDVKVPRGSELVHVAVSHSKPALAKAAVDAVLGSYEKIESELNGMSVEGLEKTLLEIQKDLRFRLDALRKQALDLAMEHGTDDLDQLSQTKMNTLLSLESSIAELNLRIAEVESAATLPPPEFEGREEAPLNLNALAARDPELQRLLAKKKQLKRDYDRLGKKLLPTHRDMIDLKQELTVIEDAIQEQAKEAAAMPNPSEPGMLGEGASLDQLRSMRDNLQRQRDRAGEDLRKLGATRMKILSVREEAADVKRDLDDTTSRLNEIQVERDNLRKGRVQILQKGDMPVAPSTDRRIPLAAFGALFGLGLGGGLVWLYGFLRDGYRSAEDLETARLAAPLLGIIPDLTNPKPGDDEHAALSVHHIRNTLQLQTNADNDGRGRVFTVTSPSAGEGKTHLALALGMSFAMGGRRTLLIDADLVGRSLTAQLGLRGAKGLSEAISADSLNGEVHASQPNLWAIPAGAAADFRPELLSSTAMARLIDQTRGTFDTIIIDSGPIMGSLEANLASSLSDRVVLVVARGQDPKAVRSALGRLHGMGVACAGLVFNRALSSDFARSVSAMSLSSRTSRRSEPATESTPTALTRVLEGSRSDNGRQ